VDGKSNEITAIPELINLLDLEGHILSFGAMGCQKNMARKLDMTHADYLQARKADYGALHKQAEEIFH
jgi:predicted transposase YbfD/YdcC